MDKDEGNELPKREWHCDKCYYHCAFSAAGLVVHKLEKYITELFLYRRPGCQTGCLDDKSLKEHFKQWSDTQPKKCVTICGKRQNPWGQLDFFFACTPNIRARNVVLRRQRLLSEVRPQEGSRGSHGRHPSRMRPFESYRREFPDFKASGLEAERNQYLEHFHNTYPAVQNQ